MEERVKGKIVLCSVLCDGMDKFVEELGLGYIAAWLRKNKYEVMLIQASAENIKYDEIEAFQPQVVAYSMYGVSKHEVYRVCEQVKKLLPDSFTIAGGYFVSQFFDEVLKEEEYIDCIIRGEGEMVMLETIEHYFAGKDFGDVKGLVYRKDGEIIFNPSQELIKDLDMLPWPSRDILVKNKLKIVLVSTSRGCNGRCSFCPSHSYWRCWRGRSPENIVEEIEHIYNTYKISLFNFIDCSFEDPDKECARLKEIAQRIVDKKLRISWFCDMRAEFRRKATPELMELLYKSGMCGVCIGIESANDKDLKLYKKIASVEDNTEVVKLFTKYKINMIYGFINFNPYSDFEGLYKNIDYLEKNLFAINVDTIVNAYTVYKDSDMYNRIVKDGLMTDFHVGAYGYSYGYHFVDHRIESLCHYIGSHVKEVNERVNSAFIKLKIYGNDFVTILNHVTRFAHMEQNEKLMNMCCDCEKTYYEIKREANASVAQATRELIKLAEENWSEEAADEIFHEKYLSDRYLKEIIARFESLIFPLYTKLLREEPSFCDIFEYISR